MAAPDSSPVRQKRLDDFRTCEVLGHGAFGEVRRVTDLETGRDYAMKVLSKAHILREKKMEYVKVERDVMSRLSHPNITRLALTFQDNDNLYYVIEFARNGDLQHVLDSYHTLDVPCATVAAAQTFLGIACMHKNRIIHRDMKPENLLLDDERRVKISDFGTAKIFERDVPFETQRGSFVGSADYVSPETLAGGAVGPSSDLWSYGCILYTLFVGTPPFQTESNIATFERIEKLDFTIPDFVPIQVRDLITKLLRLNPAERLGHGEYDSEYPSIRDHPFFVFLDWNEIATHPMPPWAQFEPAGGPAPVQTSAKQPLVAAQSVPLIPSMRPVAPQAAYENARLSSPMVGGSAVKDTTIVLEGIITKKGQYLGAKKRRLILTAEPRLFYADTSSRDMKREVPLTEDTIVTVQKGKRWMIEIPGKVYTLTAEDVTGEQWKAAIERAIAGLPKSPNMF
jgi:3-phosphoinositide dependent protein kinase-1